MLKVHIPLEPVAQERARSDAQGKFYTPRKTRLFKDSVRRLIKPLNPLIDSPIVLTAKFYFKRPKSVRSTVKTTRPDLDNLLKSIQDALNGHIYRDDALIWSYGIGTGKYYDDNPRIELILDYNPKNQSE